MIMNEILKTFVLTYKMVDGFKLGFRNGYGYSSSFC